TLKRRSLEPTPGSARAAVAELGWFDDSAHQTMRRIIRILIIAVATFSVAAGVWFWALRPLRFASYLTSAGASDVDIVRQYWPHRLVEPEWLRATPNRLMNWHFAETLARL